MSNFQIVSYIPEQHKTWLTDYLNNYWGSTRMVTRGRLFEIPDFPAFIGIVEGKPQGVLSYHIQQGECEILLLGSLVEGIGLGSALVEQGKQFAFEGGCRRYWVITTNDNSHAMRWYQKRGFRLAAVHINALEGSRKLKPEIPLIGMDGIPLRDEFEFEMMLKDE